MTRGASVWARRLLAACALMLVSSAAAVCAQRPVILGIAPFVGPHALLELFGPMSRYLEGKIGRPVYLATAPDSLTFAERSLNGEYDFVIVSPHVARFLAEEDRFTVLAGGRGHISTVFVVRKNSAITTIADLKGKTIAVHDPSSMSALQGRARLAAADMVEGKDFRFYATSNMMTAMYAVAYGRLVAAVVGQNVLAMMPPKVRAGLRMLPEAGHYDLVGVLMAEPHVPARLGRNFGESVKQYFDNTEQGRQVMKIIGFERVVDLTAADLAPYAKLAAALRDAPAYAGYAAQRDGGRERAVLRRSKGQ